MTANVICVFRPKITKYSILLWAKLLCSQASSGLVANVFHITISPLNYCVIKRFSSSTLTDKNAHMHANKKGLDEHKLFYENHNRVRKYTTWL